MMNLAQAARVTEFVSDNQEMNTKSKWTDYTAENNINVKKRSNSSLPVMMNHFVGASSRRVSKQLQPRFIAPCTYKIVKEMVLELYSKQW